MTDSPSLIEWAQKEFAFTVKLPEHCANKRLWLREAVCQRVLRAMSCLETSLDTCDAVLSEATLCRFYAARSQPAKRASTERALSQVRRLFSTLPAGCKLPIPTTVASTLLLRPTESLFDLLVRLNSRCPSEYLSRAGIKARRKVPELQAELKHIQAELTETKSREPGLRVAFQHAESNQRTSDYASAQSKFLAQRHSLDEGLRSLVESADVFLEKKPADDAKYSIAKRTASLRFLRADVKHARKHSAELFSGKPLIFSVDGCKIKGFNLAASTISAYLPSPEDCVIRLPLPVHHLTGSCAIDYDSSTERAFQEVGLEEKAIIHFGSDGSATNLGSKTGALKRQRERTGAILTLSGLCHDHTVDVSWSTATLAQSGRDIVK